MLKFIKKWEETYEVDNMKFILSLRDWFNEQLI